jgi:hypothetical protein
MTNENFLSGIGFTSTDDVKPRLSLRFAPQTSDGLESTVHVRDETGRRWVRPSLPKGRRSEFLSRFTEVSWRELAAAATYCGKDGWK